MSRKELKALGSQRESLSTNPLLIRVCCKLSVYDISQFVDFRLRPVK